MNDSANPTPDPRRVRIGLAVITVVVLVAAAASVWVDDPLGRTLMLVIALVGVVRAFLLSRTLRRE